MRSWYRIAVEWQASEDYRGTHQSPDREGGAPLYDMTIIYPDDIYSNDAVRYYGHGESFDMESISIIDSAKGRPNLSIMIYRAVPDVNAEVNVEIKSLSKILSYYRQFGFFPMNTEIVHELEEKYPIERYEYDQQQQMILGDIESKINELSGQLRSDLKINEGDWVTISRSYAKEHGESTLMGSYKIISKRVKAKDIFTDGNSIHEWGYYPS